MVISLFCRRHMQLVNTVYGHVSIRNYQLNIEHGLILTVGLMSAARNMDVNIFYCVCTNVSACGTQGRGEKRIQGFGGKARGREAT
jgi:hypothetical protein